MDSTSLDAVTLQISKLLASNTARKLIGIVGKPGSGKSTIVAKIQESFKPEVLSVISMDGYHLSNEELIKLDRLNRKGAPDTFDVNSFVALLKKVKNNANVDHKYPVFHRELEASIADEGIVPSSTKIIVIEGNYLLSNQGSWSEVFPLLDHSWYLEVEEEVRITRLIERHIRYGKTPKEAEDWSRGSDEVNAQFIGLTAHLAENVIKVG